MGRLICVSIFVIFHTDKCYSAVGRCNGQKDCVNGEDETHCKTAGRDYFSPPGPPAVVDFTNHMYTVRPFSQPDVVQGRITCPETHYQCPKGYCLPVFTRCNGVYDCTERHDEAECGNYQCANFYRCRDSQTCLHPSHLCDGVYHCPQSDDELFCDLHCPSECTCHGLALSCHQLFPADLYPDLKYLKARGSGMKMEHMVSNMMLVYLNLANCHVSGLGNVSFPNLVALDISDNQITSLTHTIQNMHNLQVLFISNNPLSNFLQSHSSHEAGHGTILFDHIQLLHLSGIELSTIDDRIGNMFSNVQILNLSDCGTRHVTERSLQSMVNLQSLDFTGCELDGIQKDVFKDLSQLSVLYADDYRLCCSAVLLDNFDLNNCHAPVNELSSCNDLLRSTVYRGVLSTLSFFAILGNLVSAAFRVVTIRKGEVSGFTVLVIHLCVSDLLMGLYLAVIGVADRMYKNVYIWHDVSWRHSAVCQLAGFLALLSSEVSAFIICLITLDRFLVVHFPLNFLNFSSIQAQLASAVCWTIGLLLAAVPIFPSLAHWKFYSQTGICIPLPITRKQFPGHVYAFAVMILLNLILFLIIASGQTGILYSVQSSRTSLILKSQKSQDNNISRRLFTIAMSDFLCWFPIGLLGVLASQGVSVSGEVNVAMAIFVLPLNSAMNPFLYTLNVLMEKRRQAKEDRLLKWIETH